jgi:broad specificity phosphatase PhoE
VSATALCGTLFLVRHGRTAANKSRYVGWGNPPLDEEGARQAAELAATLRGERIDRVYASPLLRAVQTALPIASLRDLEIKVRAELREINYGEYEGLTKDHRLHLRRAHRIAPMPGGESLFDLYQRVAVFGAELREVLRSGQRVAAVGHFWSNRMLAGYLRDLQFAAIVDAPLYKPANGSIYEIEYPVDLSGVALTAVSVHANAMVAGMSR